MPRFVDQLGYVQQRLRRNAAAIQTDSARISYPARHPRLLCANLKFQSLGRKGINREGHQGPRRESHGFPSCTFVSFVVLSFFRFYPCTESRKGCSNASAIQRRKRAASAPSIKRWS